MDSFREMLHSEYGMQLFQEDCCFLCGSSSADITQEHIFPKWLQKKYNLWTERLTLLNRTLIQYKKLKVPCCSECNNEHLSSIENRIRQAVHAGYEESVSASSLDWYLWAGKIFYSVLRKEMTLLADQKEAGKGPIINEKVMRSFDNLHLFLQAARHKLRFNGQTPYTVLICNLHDLGSGLSYHFKDDFLNFSIAIRMGEVGVIVSFEDAGLIDSTFGRYVEEIRGRKLHPIQFDELYAKVCYQLSLVEYSLKYITSSHTEGKNEAVTSTFAGGPIRKWDQQEFAECLLCHIRPWLRGEVALDSVFVPPDLVSTWMNGPEGEPLLLTREEWGCDAENGS
ncbi:hypothetical protein [Marinobacterium aestuariivivens]|uniref:HNH nuclease domain-containing protein n=1 Tax=Marinobacterium aestuariivivens TaxID=1698799 RepID=A0ABW1ZY79_9GAMM